MMIQDIPAGSPLTITAYSDDKSADLESEVLALSEADQNFLAELLEKSNFHSCTVVTLFVNDNQTINFSSQNVHCDCIAVYKNLPYLWEHVTIIKFNLPDAGSQHVIFSSHDARSFNRRKEFRLWVGMNCTLTFGSPATSIQATLKDISVNGMGLLVNPDCKIERGTRVKVQFVEVKRGHDGEESTITYTLFTQAIRTSPVNERLKLVGCRITEGSKAYVNFLYKKQRESMQREKGTDL